MIASTQCYIYYELDGETRRWGIGAHPEKDNEDSIREHLARWIPDAVYVRHVWGDIGETREEAETGLPQLIADLNRVRLKEVTAASNEVDSGTQK